MTKQSPHKRWKGCCMMCSGFVRGDGWANRRPARDLRRFDGRSRRIKRNAIPKGD